ncbi:MAG: hypothetical protein JNK67_12505, partial [Alphaproteobacteria bacterium]|nr:hypothetical protein [Alphaproteobacteria bacterium]
MPDGTAKDPTLERLILDDLTVMQSVPHRGRRPAEDLDHPTSTTPASEDLRELAGVHIGDTPSTQGSDASAIAQSREAAARGAIVAPSPKDEAEVASSVARDRLASDPPAHRDSESGEHRGGDDPARAAGAALAPVRDASEHADADASADETAPVPAPATGSEMQSITAGISVDATAQGATQARVVDDPVDIDVTASRPMIVTSGATGIENSAITLSIAASLTDTDGSESLSLVIAGVPAGATLSAGVNNGDGTWSLAPSDLAGLTVTPPAGDDTDFTLTVMATATESATGDRSTAIATVPVTVVGVADAPNLSTSAAAGGEDGAIALSIASSLTDTDGSESLSILISGVPAGATLSAGTANPDGTWTLTSGQLSGLTITPPANSDADFTLTVVSTATESDGGDTAHTTTMLAVTVAADADAPSLSASAASGTEDTAIALSITSALTDTDGSESQSILISGVPAGATLSAGTANPDGTWTLSSGQLSGLTITPPANSDADFTLTVVSTAT